MLRSLVQRSGGEGTPGGAEHGVHIQSFRGIEAIVMGVTGLSIQCSCGGGVTMPVWGSMNIRASATSHTRIVATNVVSSVA